MNKHNKNKKGKKLIATNNKKTHIIVPIIAMLILISFITTIVVGIHLTNNNNQQIAEVENGEEEILAETTTIEREGTYTVPKDGIYRINVAGGRGANNGGYGKLIEVYVNLNKNSELEFVSIDGNTDGGDAMCVYSKGTILAGAAGRDWS